MTEYTFEHNGIKIDILPSGKFTATVEGEELTAASLVSLKKKLDERKTFQGFPALRLRHGKIYEIRVVGEARSQSGVRYWKCSNGETWYTVYADTAENRAILRTYIKQTEDDRQEIIAELARRKAALRAILATITTISPEEVKNNSTI